MSALGPFLERTVALGQKELLHVVRDRQAIYLALGMPVVLVLLFGYAVTFDVEHLELGVVDQDRSPASRRLLAALRASDAFRLRDDLHLTHPDEAQAAFRRGAARGAVVIAPGFGRTLARGGTASFQLLMDGSDGTATRIALNYATEIAQQETGRLVARTARAIELPLAPKVRPWFNPDLRSALFVVPGLVAIVVGVLAVLLSALAVAREWERGSMEQLFATPVGRLSVVLGKLLPYVALGVVQILLVLAAGAWLFDVPLRGSFLLLALLSVLFLTCVLGQGLLISMVTRNQQVATQAGAVASILPALLPSGFLFPLENMPLVLRGISHVVPARYAIAGFRGVLLQGYGLAQLWPQFLGLALLGLFLIAVTTVRFRRRLD